MTRRGISTVFKAVAVFTAGAVFAAAARAADGSGAAFLKIGPSVGGEALGGLNPAVSFGAQAAGVNPANASRLEGSTEFTSGFATLIGQSQYGQASLAFRRGEG